MNLEEMAVNISKDKSYLFSLDYGNREVEKEFVRAVLTEFDRFSLTGIGIFVNNNPYNFELYLALSFEKEDRAFDEWLNSTFPHKLRAYNIYVRELIEAVSRKGYSLVTFCNPNDVDIIMTSNKNDLFLHPDKKVIESIWGKPVIDKKKQVFLSHSSLDKAIVNDYFSELQKSEIKAWYDSEGIIAGDSITSKVSEGLRDSDLGILFVSNNFLSKRSGWTEAETNYFIQQKMKHNKKFIVVNLGVSDDDMPPLLEDYRYIDAKSDSAIEELISSVRTQLNRI